MRILIFGGTNFVGRHITQALLDGGHRVTLFARGRTNPALFPAAERIHGDRNAPLTGLRGRAGGFDACVDVSGYTLSQVERALEAVGATVGRYVFISTVSVYRAPIHANFSEEAPVEIPDEPYAALTPARYGRLKVACEEVVRAKTGHRATIFRLGLVNGPHDHTDRATSWAVRALQGGTMFVPAAADTPFQVIDARDIGDAAARAIAFDVAGTFTLVQSPTTWQAWIATAAALTDRVPVRNSALLPDGPMPAEPLFAGDQAWVEEQASSLTGSRPGGALPMYLPEQYGWEFWQASNARARSAGFTFTPYERTIRDTLAWRLSPDQEEQLIQAWWSRER